MAVLLYIAIVVATGILAARKQRSVFGWVLLSIFFPLISLLILACLSGLGSGWKCPYCEGELPSKGVRVCMHCRRALEESPRPSR